MERGKPSRLDFIKATSAKKKSTNNKECALTKSSTNPNKYSRTSSTPQRKSKTPNGFKDAMKDSHSAIYHRSGFTVSEDLSLLPPETETKEEENTSTQCRICQSYEDSIGNQLVTPCGCIGSLRFVHLDCLKRWRQTKRAKGLDICICELCKQPYNVELLGQSDVHPDKAVQMQEDLKKLVKSGIYLMLLMRSWKGNIEQANLSISSTHLDDLAATALAEGSLPNLSRPMTNRYS